MRRDQDVTSIMTPASRGGAEVRRDRRPPTISTRGGGARRIEHSSPALAPRDTISCKKRHDGFTEGPTVKGAISMLVLSVEKRGSSAGGGVQTFYSLQVSFCPLALAGNFFFFSFKNQNKKLGKRWFSTEEKEKERLIISFTILHQCFLFDLCLSKGGFRNLERGQGLKLMGSVPYLNEQTAWGGASACCIPPGLHQHPMASQLLSGHMFCFKIKLFQLQIIKREKPNPRDRHAALGALFPFPLPKGKAPRNPPLTLLCSPERPLQRSAGN